AVRRARPRAPQRFRHAPPGPRRSHQPDRRSSTCGEAVDPGPIPSDCPSSMSAVDDLPPLGEVIRQHGLRAKKSLGQNFLLDLNLTARIARAAAPPRGRDLVRIRPGPGGLTRGLLAAGARRVIAIERDDRTVAALEQIARRYPGRLKIVAGDALDFDPRPLVGGASARIVANLPYNIATALLVGW